MAELSIDELIQAIRALEYDGVRLTNIEKGLKMGRNSLSGMLNKKRPFPKKWQQRLTEYVQSPLRMPVLPTSAFVPISLPTPDPVKPPTILEPKRPTPPAEPPEVPPPGLSKSQQLRWHRENSQTLR